MLYIRNLNTGQKISVIKFSPMRAGGEFGENILLVKISKLWYLPYRIIKQYCIN